MVWVRVFFDGQDPAGSLYEPVVVFFRARGSLYEPALWMSYECMIRSNVCTACLLHVSKLYLTQVCVAPFQNLDLRALHFVRYYAH